MNSGIPSQELDPMFATSARADHERGLRRRSARRLRLQTFVRAGTAYLASVCAFLGCAHPAPPSSAATDSLEGLVTTYVLLDDTLSEESKLGALGFLRKITFRTPIPEIDELMSRIATVSKTRLEELEELRRLPPDVSDVPPFDPVGETITLNASRKGMNEMLGREGSFGIRFVLIQAQATRMISAIAETAAGIETNEQRRRWLLDLAEEFEGIRDELVVILEKYVQQEGAAQLD